MLLLGCLFDRKKEGEILSLSRCGVSNAVNTFQWNLICGINQAKNEPINIINVLPVGIFPRQYKKLWLKQTEWSFEGSTNTEIGSINLPFFKQWMRTKRIQKAIQKSGEKNILIYSTYLPFLKAVEKLDDSYKITLVVTDLPAYYDLGKISAIRRFLRKLNNRVLYKCLHRVDLFVLLTEQMKEPLKVGDRPYIVVEGIAGEENVAYKSEAKRQTNKKIILYTGSLQYQFGIKNLLDAFASIKSEAYELWICGNGEAAKEIENRAKTDARIHFFGYVPKSKTYELQQQATVLINPRKDEGEYTKYSFPSKTIEYMMSGVPVIMYKLAGIPDEYAENLYYVQGDSVDDLKKTIVSVCEQDKKILDAFGAKAREFVMTKKNAEVQGKRILSLME